jgi:hypothetical protein
MKLSYLFILTITVAGCDDVFGLTGYERACELRTFAGAPTQLASGDDVSRDDAGLLVGVSAGLPFEVAPGGTAQPIDLGVYVPVGVSLSPEGDELFYSAEIEPPLLQLAHRAGDDSWTVGGAVPAGRFAGAPTAAELGPRHVLVRTNDATTDVQEYVETDRQTWAATGAVMQVPSVFAPSLLPNGLTLVYATTEDADAAGAGVYAAQRDSVDDRFGAPRLVRAGTFGAATLSPLCDQLVAADADTHDIEVFR